MAKSKDMSLHEILNEKEDASPSDEDKKKLAAAIKIQASYKGFKLRSSLSHNKYLPIGQTCQAEFHCALQKSLLIQGKLYFSDEYAAFHSSILGFKTHELIKLSNITNVELRSLLLIPNSIRVTTTQGDQLKKYFFTNFIHRQDAYNFFIKRAKVNNLTVKENNNASNSSNAGELSLAGSLFGNSLENIYSLEQPENQNNQNQLTPPIILTSLIQLVGDLGGYSSQGIFRLSVSVDEFNKIHNLIQLGALKDKNFSYENLKNINNNPHVYAALIKDWLRSLSEPLIPVHLYNQAIASVKPSQNSESSNVDNLILLLPARNLAVMKSLSAMCEIISSPANVKTSLMTMENLAIVFAPSFLRNPSFDPAVIIANLSYETKFTLKLLNTLIKQK